MRPKSSKEGTPWLVCRQDARSSGLGTQQVLVAGAERAEGSGGPELWRSSAAGGTLAGSEKQREPLPSPCLPVSNRQVPSTTCQEASWERSQGNEFRG